VVATRRAMGNDSKGAGWNFDAAFDAPPPESASGPPVSAQVSRPRPQTPSRGRARPRRGQRLSWASLSLAIVCSLAIGFGLYGALVSIAIKNDAFAHVSRWMTCVVVALCVLALNLGTSFLALVWARPRVVATLSLMATLVLPIVAAIAGAKFGTDMLVELFRERAAGIGHVAIEALVRHLEEQGYAAAPVLSFLLQLL
jgi:hypothetical protein